MVTATSTADCIIICFLKQHHSQQLHVILTGTSVITGHSQWILDQNVTRKTTYCSTNHNRQSLLYNSKCLRDPLRLLVRSSGSICPSYYSLSLSWNSTTVMWQTTRSWTAFKVDVTTRFMIQHNIRYTGDCQLHNWTPDDGYSRYPKYVEIL
jgi:hypothetical protein